MKREGRTEGYRYDWRIKHITFSDESEMYIIERREKNAIFGSWRGLKNHHRKREDAIKQFKLEVEYDRPPLKVCKIEIIDAHSHR